MERKNGELQFDPILESLKNKTDWSTVERIISLDNSSLQSLLLFIFQKRANEIESNKILRNSERQAFIEPSDIDQRVFHDLETIIFDVLPDYFSSIELSPVNSFGLNAGLTQISQKNVMTTIRNTEVVADATTALAVLAARQRKTDLTREVNISTHHRTLRLQQYEKGSGFTPHFKVLAMCTAGKDTGSEELESRALKDHLGTYLSFLQRLQGSGVAIEDVTVSLSDMRISEKLIAISGFDRKEIGRHTRNRDLRPLSQAGSLDPYYEDLSMLDDELIQRLNIANHIFALKHCGLLLFESLERKFPNVKFVYEIGRTGGIGYYQDVVMKIEATNVDGSRFQVADGGFVDWTQKMLSNRKEKLLISGIGTEFVYRMFANGKRLQ